MVPEHVPELYERCRRHRQRSSRTDRAQPKEWHRKWGRNDHTPRRAVKIVQAVDHTAELLAVEGWMIRRRWWTGY